MITLSKKQIHDQGRFGIYFRLNRSTGVKILKNKGYKDPQFILKNIKTNAKLQSSVKEATLGKLADSTTQGLVLVKFNSLYYLGIKQKHIGGKIILNLGDKDVEAVKKNLKKKNIIHGDLNPRNILKTRRGLTPIDFDAERCFFIGKKAHYYTFKNRLIKKLLVSK